MSNADDIIGAIGVLDDNLLYHIGMMFSADPDYIKKQIGYLREDYQRYLKKVGNV